MVELGDEYNNQQPKRRVKVCVEKKSESVCGITGGIFFLLFLFFFAGVLFSFLFANPSVGCSHQ